MSSAKLHVVNVIQSPDRLASPRVSRQAQTSVRIESISASRFIPHAASCLATLVACQIYDAAYEFLSSQVGSGNQIHWQSKLAATA